MQKCYNFKVKWYVENNAGEDYVPCTDYGIVAADSMGEAVSIIEKRFPETDTIDIHYIDFDDMLFITEEVYDRLNNGDYFDGEYVIGERAVDQEDFQ